MGARRAFRDVEYAEPFVSHKVVVELVGRLGHEDAGDRWTDLNRDIAAAVSGRLTLRVSWRQVLTPMSQPPVDPPEGPPSNPYEPGAPQQPPQPPQPPYGAPGAGGPQTPYGMPPGPGGPPLYGPPGPPCAPGGWQGHHQRRTTP